MVEGRSIVVIKTRAYKIVRGVNTKHSGDQYTGTVFRKIFYFTTIIRKRKKTMGSYLNSFERRVEHCNGRISRRNYFSNLDQNPGVEQ